MNKFSNRLLVLGSLLVFFAIAPISSYGQDKAEKPQNVNVVNTPNVNVANSPNVNVTNTPKVLNANDSNIFQERRDKDINLPVESVSFTVPQGKRLVIEFVSVRTTVGEGEQVEAFILAGSGGNNNAFHPIIMTFQRNLLGKDFVVGGQQMRMYAEPGTLVEILVSRAKGGVNVLTDAHIQGSISGYLVDVQ
jgi:hypothetical protein